MLDLTDLLSDAADREVPSSLRPFEDLVRTRDTRRRRRSVVASLAVVAIVGGAAVALARPGHPASSRLVDDPTPSPGPASTCDPTAMDLSLHWAVSSAGLLGTLTAKNATGTTCALLRKPWVYLLDADGNRVSVQTAQFSDGRYGDDRLPPGDSATSMLTWSSWCGGDVTHRFEITWDEGATVLPPAKVTSEGEDKPLCNGFSSGITSTWFEGLSPATPQQRDQLTVSGTFELDGGPYPGHALAQPGFVDLTADSGRSYHVQTTQDGRFALEVAPGHYAITGGSGSDAACSLPVQITVTDHDVAGVALHCAIP